MALRSRHRVYFPWILFRGAFSYSLAFLLYIALPSRAEVLFYHFFDVMIPRWFSLLMPLKFSHSLFISFSRWKSLIILCFLRIRWHCHYFSDVGITTAFLSFHARATCSLPRYATHYLPHILDLHTVVALMGSVSQDGACWYHLHFMVIICRFRPPATKLQRSSVKSLDEWFQDGSILYYNEYLS